MNLTPLQKQRLHDAWIASLLPVEESIVAVYELVFPHGRNPPALMSGIQMWAVLFKPYTDLETAALFRQEADAKQHRLAWHGDDGYTKVRPVLVQFVNGIDSRAQSDEPTEPGGMAR